MSIKKISRLCQTPPARDLCTGKAPLLSFPLYLASSSPRETLVQLHQLSEAFPARPGWPRTASPRPSSLPCALPRETLVQLHQLSEAFLARPGWPRTAPPRPSSLPCALSTTALVRPRSAHLVMRCCPLCKGGSSEPSPWGCGSTNPRALQKHNRAAGRSDGF